VPTEFVQRRHGSGGILADLIAKASQRDRYFIHTNEHVE
jgi:hypothetical protein